MTHIIHKRSILNIYFTVLLLSSLVHGYIRLRFGAGFELYLFFIIFLLILFIYRLRRIVFIKEYLWLCIILLFSFIANLIGYIESYDKNLVDSFNQNITFVSKLFIDSFRFYIGISFLFISFWLIASLDKLLKAIYIFLIGAFIQALYGIYEFSIKFLGTSLFLFNEKSIQKYGIIRSYGTFFEPSQYGIFIGASIFLYLVYLKLMNYKGNKNFFTEYKNTIFLIFIFALLFSLSRAAFIAFLLSIIPISLKSFYKPKVILMVFVFVCSILFIPEIYSYFEEKIVQGFTISESTYENTLNNRIDGIFNIYYTGLLSLVSNPLGYGIGSSYFIFGNPGVWFKLGYELGIFSFIAIAIIILVILHKTIKVYFIKIELLSLLSFMIISLQNYDAYFHIWILFIFYVAYRVPYFLIQQDIRY